MNRRNFIKTGVAAGMAASCGSLLSAPLRASVAREHYLLTASAGEVRIESAQQAATQVMYYNQSIP
ncbi:MAG: twin-arginine translocation signal domain-containing protein, partial [Gammaproteobacteria bacterium]